jgi:hypothetical protein
MQHVLIAEDVVGRLGAVVQECYPVIAVLGRVPYDLG